MKRVSIMIAMLLCSLAASASQIYSGNQCSSFGGWDTWANLAVEKPASSNICTEAWTADQGFVYSDGSNWVIPGGNGVTSVGLSAPSVFSVSGTPVGPGTGTLALSFATGQTANRFLATPNGSTGALSLRALVAADIPTPLTASTSGNASTATALASAPTQCTGSNFSTGVAASGNANCSIPATPPISTPNARSLSLATAFQASDSARAAMVTVNLTSTATISLSGGTTNTATVVIGSTSAVASGTGTVINNYSNSNTGTLTIGLNLSTVSAVPVTFALPKNWFFAVLQTSGTVSITSAFDQAIG